MKSFRDILQDGSFPVTYEPDAPSGTNLSDSLIGEDLDAVDVLCVYNNPGGRPKLDPFVYGWKLKEKYGKDVVVNVRTQDYSVPLFQSILWGGHVLGIENLLLVTGDYHPSSPFLISVMEGLVGINRYLNKGYLMPDLDEKAKRYSNRLEGKDPEKEYDGKTDYFTGAVLIPQRPNKSEIYRKKVEAGAEFFMTQITYSPYEIISFMEETNPSKPILVGCAPVDSMGRLKFFKDELNVGGISRDVRNRLKGAEDIGKESVEICTEMYMELKDYASDNNSSMGAHIMSVGNPERAQEIAERL